MAVDQAIHLAPGLKGLVVHLERLGEPGQPRQWWDGSKAAWSADPTVSIPVEADPVRPGVYTFVVASKDTAGWPDAYYRAVGVNPAIATPDQVVFGPFDFQVVGGSDTLTPSYTQNVMGGSVTFYNARFNPPAVPATTPAAGGSSS